MKSKLVKLGTVFDSIYSMSNSGMMDFRMYLDGRWVELPQGIEVRSPIDDGVIATVPSASEREAERAVESSYISRNRIRTIPAVKKIEIFQRAREILLQNIEHFVRVLTLEAGKPITYQGIGLRKLWAHRRTCSGSRLAWY